MSTLSPAPRPGPAIDRPRAAARLRELIPPETAAALLPHLPEIVREMVAEVERSVPEYARSRETAYARTVLMSSEEALRDFVAGVEFGGPTNQPVTEVFRKIGQGEAHLDRSLDTLQLAMHIGTEIIWRRVAEHCVRLGMPADRVARLGEALLVHFRENVRAAIDGYLEVRTRRSGELQRRRLRLLDLLLSDPPVSPEAIERVAETADWRLPETVAAVVLGDHGPTDASALDLPPEILIDLHRAEPCLVVPDPDQRGRMTAIGLALHDARAAAGPALPLADAAKSRRWAREALDLARRGLIDGAGLINCADHMATLVLFQNEDLINALAAVRLAPLAHLRPEQRDRLADTLLPWLQTGGDAAKVAAQLFVHPQTVRYRIRKLQDLFGDRLHDPDVRLELELVLRARRLRSGQSTPNQTTNVVPLAARLS